MTHRQLQLQNCDKLDDIDSVEIPFSWSLDPSTLFKRNSKPFIKSQNSSDGFQLSTNPSTPDSNRSKEVSTSNVFQNIIDKCSSFTPEGKSSETSISSQGYSASCLQRSSPQAVDGVNRIQQEFEKFQEQIENSQIRSHLNDYEESQKSRNEMAGANQANDCANFKSQAYLLSTLTQKTEQKNTLPKIQSKSRRYNDEALILQKVSIPHKSKLAKKKKRETSRTRMFKMSQNQPKDSTKPVGLDNRLPQKKIVQTGSSMFDHSDPFQSADQCMINIDSNINSDQHERNQGLVMSSTQSLSSQSVDQSRIFSSEEHQNQQVYSQLETGMSHLNNMTNMQVDSQSQQAQLREGSCTQLTVSNQDDLTENMVPAHWPTQFRHNSNSNRQFNQRVQVQTRRNRYNFKSKKYSALNNLGQDAKQVLFNETEMEATHLHRVSMQNNNTGISHLIQHVPKSMKFDQHFTMAATEPLSHDMEVEKSQTETNLQDMDEIDLELISTLSPDIRDDLMSKNASNESKLTNLTIVKRISDTYDSSYNSPLQMSQMQGEFNVQESKQIGKSQDDFETLIENGVKQQLKILNFKGEVSD